MLAQGEFLKILFAESKERADIFRKIFETDIYNQITQKLVDKQREYKENLKNLKNTFITNCSNIIWKEKPNVIDEINIKELNKLDIEEILDYLENEIKINKNDFEKLTDDSELLNKDYKKIENNIKIKIEDNNNLDKYEKVLTLRKNLQERKAYIDNLKEKIEKSQKILSIVFPKEENLINIQNELSVIEKNISSLEKNIISREEKEKQNNQKENKLEILKKLFIDYKNFDELNNKFLCEKSKIIELQNLNLEKLKQAKDYEKISNEYKELNLKYLVEEDKFFKEQAGILAEKLVEGKPCPVCGSIVHPAKAKKSENVLTKENLDKLKKVCEKKLLENSDIKDKITKLNSKIEVLLNNIEESKKDDFNLDEYSKNNEDKLSEVYKNLNKIELEFNNIYFEICNKKSKIVNFDYDKFKTEFEQSIKKEKEDLIKEKTLLKEYEFQKKNKEKNLNLAKKDYEKAYKKLGFENEEEYKSKKYSNDKIKKLTKEIDNYNKECTENNIIISQLEKLVKNKEKLDIQNDKNKLLELQKNLDIRKKELMDSKVVLDNNKRMNSSLKNTSKELLEKIDEFIIYDDMARTACGMLQGKRRIEFEQYVQSAYFDMIIIQANKRLTKMTDNRYYLIRKENAEKSSDRIGLDLEVIDNYNGKKRDVKSLSGGETFKASLSLALGLSDIIQSYSGGVLIDTLFIDEGFGSLDSESRDQAIETLSSLIDGNKLIGIISHVAELKERIDKKIVVKKGTDGSKIEY